MWKVWNGRKAEHKSNLYENIVWKAKAEVFLSRNIPRPRTNRKTPKGDDELPFGKGDRPPRTFARIFTFIK